MEWFTQDISHLDLEQPDCRDCTSSVTCTNHTHTHSSQSIRAIVRRGRLHILGNGNKLAAVATFLPITKLNVGVGPPQFICTFPASYVKAVSYSCSRQMFQLIATAEHFELYFALERRSFHPDHAGESALRKGGPPPTPAPCIPKWPRQEQDEVVFMGCSLDADATWLAIATNHEGAQQSSIVVVGTNSLMQFNLTTRGTIVKVEWRPNAKSHLYVLTDCGTQGTYLTLYCLEQSCLQRDAQTSPEAMVICRIG